MSGCEWTELGKGVTVTFHQAVIKRSSSGHQSVIKRSSIGHQSVINRSSIGNQKPSEAITGFKEESFSRVIKWQSEAIRSNQKQSEAITGFKEESFSRVESARAPVSTRDPSYMSTSWS